MIKLNSPAQRDSNKHIHTTPERVKLTDLMSKNDIAERIMAFCADGVATASVFVFDDASTGLSMLENEPIEQIHGENPPCLDGAQHAKLLELIDAVRSKGENQLDHSAEGMLTLTSPIWLKYDGHNYLKGCFAGSLTCPSKRQLESSVLIAKFVADTISDRITYAFGSRVARYEYQALEHELKLDSELAAMMENIGAKLMVVDRDLNIVWHNSVITKRCNGVSPRGKLCYEAMGAVARCNPCPAVMTFKTGKPQLNVYGKNSDGMIANRTSAMPILDSEGKIHHVLVLINDVNDAAEASQAAAELASYKHLINSSDDFMLMCDNSGQVLAVNKKMIETLGYAESDLIGKHGNSAVVTEDLHKFHDVAQSAMQLGIAMDSVRVQGKNGEIIPTQMMLAYDKERSVYEIIFRNISERLQMEKELRERSEELQAQNFKVLAMAEERDRFFRNVSHELRTPLTSIIGFAELLFEDIDEPLSKRQKQQLQRVVGNSHKLLSMVNDIMDISKIDAGRMEIHIGSLKLHEFIPHIAANLTPLAKEKNLALNLHLDDKLPTVHTDENKLGQILVNLISNAIKFTNQGTIDITATAQATNFEISVKDTGIGIPETDLKEIFKEFHRAHTQASSVRGSGLGLTIAQGMAGLLGGKILVESEVGKGSTFTISLPIALSASPN
ncbi:MAG: ATP-binding protein [Armatimonadetes bacterium]|nr:ATP-binding protein [Armatimonadota bacterium]